MILKKSRVTEEQAAPETQTHAQPEVEPDKHSPSQKAKQESVQQAADNLEAMKKVLFPHSSIAEKWNQCLWQNATDPIERALLKSQNDNKRFSQIVKELKLSEFDIVRILSFLNVKTFLNTFGDASSDLAILANTMFASFVEEAEAVLVMHKP
ncbi:MAG: hypothetical protein LBV23_05840 [Deltaproteobacteria bacterium]|jgi:excinuclease UvrABC nuclease subunit|nr:hypothetical protein [Deltaproteobacteria bacterium]